MLDLTSGEKMVWDSVLDILDIYIIEAYKGNMKSMTSLESIEKAMNTLERMKNPLWFLFPQEGDILWVIITLDGLYKDIDIWDIPEEVKSLRDKLNQELNKLKSKRDEKGI